MEKLQRREDGIYATLYSENFGEFDKKLNQDELNKLKSNYDSLCMKEEQSISALNVLEDKIAQLEDEVEVESDTLQDIRKDLQVFGDIFSVPEEVSQEPEVVVDQPPNQ